MDVLVRAALVCLLAALFSSLLRRKSPETALLLAVAALGIVFAAILSPLREVADYLKELAEMSGVEPRLFAPLGKVLAISVVVKLAASLCRDAGESALAAAVETAGSVCALLASIPLFRSVLSCLSELL